MSEPEIIRLAFICTGNAARSQMAEGMARSWAKDNVWVESAGLCPMGLAPNAVKVMAEIGIDISAQYSKGLDKVDRELDFVITLCDHAAKYCPSIPAKRERVHWSIPDPGGDCGDRGDPLKLYRQARDMLAERIRTFLADRDLLKTRPLAEE